jgi:hypothetical protein
MEVSRWPQKSPWVGDDVAGCASQAVGDQKRRSPNTTCETQAATAQVAFADLDRRACFHPPATAVRCSNRTQSCGTISVRIGRQRKSPSEVG